MQTNYSDLDTTRSDLQTWSTLNTVSNFDAGSTVVVGMSENGVALRDVNQFSPTSLLVESLVEELCKLLSRNSKQQKALYDVICGKLYQMNLIDQSYNVEEFEFMRTYYQKALLQLLTVAKSVTTIGPHDGALLRLPRYKPKAPEFLLSSRYRTEFEELEYIARGGFGRVYKSRNKLDGMNYAIKKICLQYHNVAAFLHNLHEVKMLARLNHPNIVTYKAAWLEPLSPAPQNSTKVQTKSSDEESGSIVFESSFHEESTCHSVKTSPRKETVYRIEKTTYEESSCHSVKVTTQEETSSDLLGACALPTQVSPDSNNSISTIDDSDSSQDNMVCTYQSTTNSFVNVQKMIVYESAMLYVQMQLCDRTLRQWLDDRNSKVPIDLDMKQNLKIFEQIVQGVCYIHSQQIIHHDIKPSNIFINSDLTQVQVGDFGLACYLQHSPDEVTLLTDYAKHGEIGTKLYAAPEQLRGRCDPKSDVYSLGVVLFEILQPFSTDMERCKVITQLRQGNIPTELTVVAPKWSQQQCITQRKNIVDLVWVYCLVGEFKMTPYFVNEEFGGEPPYIQAQLISRLMKSSPALRPTAYELKEMLLPLIRETEEGSESVDSMKQTIQQLMAVILEKDKEIEDLQKRLRNLETPTSLEL